MALYELGPIAYLNKGAYDASTVYTKYDVVLYNNGSYVYVNDTDLSGNLPTDATYWQAMLDPTAMNEATRFVHIKYSNYASPTNAQTNSTSGDYIGISVTNSQDAPTTSSSYTWNKIKGADGAKGETGDTGAQGPIGNVMYATFDIDFDTGELIMTIPDGYTGPTFSINDETGELEVSI